jgi:hypothetical protein
MKHVVCLCAAVVLVVAGCSVEYEEDDEGGVAQSDTCAEGLQWSGGDEEDPRMHPGRDCIACHAREHEGPTYTIAGTVAPAAQEPDDCFGVAGVTVEITDANGGVYQLTTNQAGNFYLRDAIAVPYTARLVFEGRERRMVGAQSVGACNSCHTETGVNDAPGRIIVP